MARGKAPCLQNSQPSVAQDFTVEPYLIPFLLNSEFPDPDSRSLLLLRPSRWPRRMLLRPRLGILSWGYSISLQRKHILDCSRGIPSLTQPVWPEPAQVVRNPDGTAQGIESIEKPLSQTLLSDAKLVTPGSSQTDGWDQGYKNKLLFGPC